MRKTIDVRFATEKANHFLAESKPTQQTERRVLASYLEVLLFEANAYQGFRYLDVPFDSDLSDQTRRHYYIHPQL